MSIPSFFQKNLDALQKNNPKLAHLISSSPDIPAISLAKLEKSGASPEWEIFCRFADGTSKPYYGGYSPVDYSKDIIRRLSLKNPRILIFSGLGLGHHLLEYARKPHPLNQAIIVLEAFPQVLKKAMEASDLTPLFNSPAVHWFVGNHAEQLKHFYAGFFSQGRYLCFANAIEYIPLPPAVDMTPQFYQEAQKLLPEAIGHQFNRLFGDPYDAYLGTKNIFDNLKRMTAMPAIDAAAGLFKGLPGIVIASGPSLSQAIPMLQKIGSKAVMVACPSALPELIRNGIEPHIWMNIERLEGQGRFFEELPKKPPHVFVAPPLVHPRCFEGNGGTNAYILGASLQSKWLPFEGEVVDLGHSSAHAAFQILQRLGCTSIFLVGQDLSYQDSQSHASGVWEESAKTMTDLEDTNHKIFDLEGNDGSKVQTNLYWATYLKTFSEQLIPNFAGQVYNVIPQNRGAKISGTTRIDPEEVEKYLGDKVFNPLSILQERLKPISAEKQKEREKRIQEKIKKAFPVLMRLMKDAQEFSLRCKEFQFEQDLITKRWEHLERKYQKFIKEVDRYSSRFGKDLNYADDCETYYHLFHPFVQGMLLRYQIEYFSSGDDTVGNFSEITRKTEILFHMAKDEAYWAKVCVDLLEKQSAN